MLDGGLKAAHRLLLPLQTVFQQPEVEICGAVVQAGLQGAFKFLHGILGLAPGLVIQGLAEMQDDLGAFDLDPVERPGAHGQMLDPAAGGPFGAVFPGFKEHICQHRQRPQLGLPNGIFLQLFILF